jgi:Fe2+ transport system protein FeoA
MPMSPAAPVSLDRLRPGERGQITDIQGNDALTQRLLEMGLLEGVAVEVLRIAPLGDPLEIQVGDYQLSLRRNEAARILVSRE